MSEPAIVTPAVDPIVVHAPLTGDSERIASLGLASASGAVMPETVSVQWRPAVQVSVAPSERLHGLDAFRGLLILAMNLAFTIPHWGPFPGWMYHMQVPPSASGDYVNTAGLTWRDMLFPMFVFTMAAALPVVMGARLARGKPYPEIAWLAIRRAFLLFVFALLIGHVNPYWTQDFTKRGNVIAIAGLVVAFLTFVRLPASLPENVRLWWRRIAWLGVAATLFALPLVYGKAFDLQRRDDIIAAVAFCTLAGTLLWLATRRRLGLRLAVAAVVAVARTAAPHVSWLGEIWYSKPFGGLYEPWYLDLLLIVVAGTIAGDLLARLARREEHEVAAEGTGARRSWSAARSTALAFLGLIVPVILCVGLYDRRHPVATTIAVSAVAGALILLTRDARSQRETVIAHLFRWSALWLVLGMVVEPLDGGIRKDPQTLAYLLVMSGTAIASLASLVIVFDAFPQARRRLMALTLVGQNALFAYVVFMLGVGHLLWLAGVGDAFTATWPIALTRSVVLTLVVGALVWITSKYRLIWKT